MSPAPPAPPDAGPALLASGEHKDPHGILGPHVVPEGVVVRALRPGAAAVALLREGAEPLPMERVSEAGLFACLAAGASETFPYRIETRLQDGRVLVERDAYAFPPTLGELDLHLHGEGRHERLWEKFGAHLREIDGVAGVSFAVWAPSARGVSVVGSFNGWDARRHPMRRLGESGIWELFVPGLGPGALYKYEIRRFGHGIVWKTDPVARAMEAPPAQATVIWEPAYQFSDQAWMEARAKADAARRPLSIYEVHLGSWRRASDPDRPLSYREIAEPLADYVADLGFTHVEFLPLHEHPLTISWGYQVSGYFAPTARYGSPDDLRALVDHLHRRGIGVIVDWVPAHFPKDGFALGRFDGTALYEHLDPRQGEHPDWGTYVFNYGRNEVRNFLFASALYWLEEMHVDGLRVDAVASMLYLDYSRPEGGWVPNPLGGRENLDAVSFLRELNDLVTRRHPGALMIAEESTAWPRVSHPTAEGGLGFGFKWNMGWMHDTLQYFTLDPILRRGNHAKLTFGLLYAWSERFILSLSHDEVVHGKGALLDKMPGKADLKLAHLRALYAYLWAHPGKKMLFMGGEIGQWREWACERSLDWDLLEQPHHRGVQRLVRDLNRLHREQPALHELDVEPAGFSWLDVHSADENVIAFQRISRDGRRVICVCNFAPVLRQSRRVGLPSGGRYRELLNSDATDYGGSGAGNAGGVVAEPVPHHGQPFSAALVLPPLGVLYLVPEDTTPGR
jgi:1,4-alpha-glucan branching enzyme